MIRTTSNSVPFSACVVEPARILSLEAACPLFYTKVFFVFLISEVQR